MPRLQRKSLDVPETVRSFAHGRISSVSLDEMSIGYFRLEPGWRWSNDVRPIVGTESCQNRHLGICLEGTLHVELADGTTIDIGPNDAYEIPPGHDAWVEGESAWISYEWASSRVFAQAPEEDGDGILATRGGGSVRGRTNKGLRGNSRGVATRRECRLARVGRGGTNTATAGWGATSTTGADTHRTLNRTTAAT